MTHYRAWYRPWQSEQLAVILVGLGVCGAAFFFRVWALDAPLFIDEGYHLLAARGWLETGRPAILEGEYTRAKWFTIAVGRLFQITGNDSIFMGRLVALPPGVLLPLVMFLWLRATAGWTAGVITAALAILWPNGIEESQTLRFYSWQVFTFATGSIAAFQALGVRGGRRAAWAVLAALSLSVALYLQLITAFGLAALLLWFSAAFFLPSIWMSQNRWTLLGLCALAAIIILWTFYTTGLLEQILTKYRWTAGWAQNLKNDVTYYHRRLLDTYPTFWPLFPIIALVSFRGRPLLASYCLVLFVVIFLGLSFAGMKAPRYLSFGMPFFFAFIALALGEVIPGLIAFVARLVRETDPLGQRWTNAIVLAAAGFFVAFANPFIDRSLDTLPGTLPGGRPSPLDRTEWSGLEGLIGNWDEVPFRITTEDIHVIANGVDYDVLLSRSRMTEMPKDREFVKDPRTGMPVIEELSSVLAILECYPEGLFVSTQIGWKEWQTDLMPLFARADLTTEIRTDSPLFVLRWHGGQVSPGACKSIPV